jgi:Carbohydrate binding domain/Calcineurin-like phosphoesterase
VLRCTFGAGSGETLKHIQRFGACSVLLALFVAAWRAPVVALAAGTCNSGGGHTICVTVPGSTLSGNATIVVTNSPNTGDVISTWIPSGKSGLQLIHEYEASPSTNDYTFVWPTQKYLDASGTLRVDYSGTQVNVPVTLANGNTSDFQHQPNDWASFLPGSWTASQDPTVLAVGDGASNELTSNAVANQVRTASPPLFLYLGDVYETGTFTEMRNQYGVSAMDAPGSATLWGATAAVTQPTIGNHEYPNKTAWIDYWQGHPLYTKFTFGGVLFLDLDVFQSISTSSAEYKFVQTALSGAPACIVAFWHTPAITGGTIKDSERALWALLANNGADLVMVGHAHTMAEYKPMDANFNTGGSAHMVQLINGAGGHDFGATLSDSRIAWAKGKTSGVTALTLNGARSGGTATSIGWTFKDVNNTLLRTGSVSCGTGAPQNQAPVVNAGPDQSVTLPSSAPLSGTATDDGLPNPPGTLTTTWSKVSGPGTVTFANASAPSTTASFSAAGTYVLRLTADDSALQTSDDLTVTVNPAPPQNQPPAVNAGPDQTVTLPASAPLSGSATDDGLPNPPGTLTTTWSAVSGPGTVTFGDPSALSTTASFSAPGTYVLRLTGDDSALQSTDDLTVTVNPASSGNQPPVVNAGPDQTVTWPASATLSGMASDDGLPNPPGTLTTTWSAVSGPGTVTFGDPSAQSTTATFSAAGTYVLRLTADDSALQSSDDVTVTATSAPPNLVGNPGFEVDTTGWNAGDSDPGVTVTRVSGGHSGGWAALVANGGSGVAAKCKLQDAPNWVKTTSSGTYTGTMWVRADAPGATLQLKLREFNGSTLVAAKTTSVALTTSWQAVTVSYVTTMPGVSTLDFMALVSNAPVGPCFYADDISLTLAP